MSDPEPFAPVPHALILSQPAPLVRLWGVLHAYIWQRRRFTAGDLAGALGVTARSIHRWLDELDAAGWISYDRQPGRAALAITLRPQPLTPESEADPTSDRRVRGFDHHPTSDRRVRGCPNL
jgi:hypothetical protein